MQVVDQPSRPGDDPKLTAIVAYLTFIGWIIAYFVLYPRNRAGLASFHLRQTLLLYIVGMGVSILTRNQFNTFTGFIAGVAGLLMFIMWLVGFVGALNRQEKHMPIIGKYAQDWFRNI